MKTPQQSSSSASPFFRPSTPRIVASTPGGSRRTIRKSVEESKSTVTGATANLINAIVGSGIVGIPFAVRQAGLVAGIGLILLCAILTEKSLRLLVGTAKYAKVPSYETVCEAAYGRAGFFFVSINMFIMAWGAMVSYLMIIKDTLPYVFGLEEIGQRRAFLFLISILIIVPLSAQRDMADLAKTSRINVTFDILMVFVVVYTAPISSSIQSQGGLFSLISHSTIRLETLFVGLGVLSFAFVCQHSAFIIAGSLDNPTNTRWAKVTSRALLLCAALATLCGVSGYLGYLDDTRGNILNNLDLTSFSGNLARTFLGTTMLFVYPMESFVARHVCVVMLFQGRRAHDGEDATILNRRDRRITLTLVLYLSAIIPAIAFANLGNVLSFTGAIGGSCLCYIGPGIVYMGIHGKAFVKMVENYWDYKFLETMPLNNAAEVSPLIASISPLPQQEQEQETPSPCKLFCKNIAWYLSGMPIWYSLAKRGAAGFEQHQQEMSLKSPRVSRINIRKHQYQHYQLEQPLKQYQQPIRPLDDSAIYNTMGSTPIKVLPQQQGPRIIHFKQTTTNDNKSNNDNNTGDNGEEDEEEEEHVPTVADFVVAVGFMILGVVALCAGLVSIYVSG